MADRGAGRLWLWLQLLVAGAALSILWPATPGGAGRGGVPPADSSGAHGTARWRRPRELARTFARVALGRLVDGVGDASVPAGLVVGAQGRGRRMSAWLAGGGREINPHCLVLGASGAGKTRRLVLPSLWLLARSGVSIITTDPKGELYSLTADYYRHRGYGVRTLNLIDPRRSDRYNPLGEITAALVAGDLARAAELAWDVAHAVVTVEASGEARGSDPFWDQAAESLIAALALYVSDQLPEPQRHMASVYQVLTDLGAGGGPALDLLMGGLPANHPARRAYGVVRLSEDKTRSGILTTAAAKLRLFADPAVEAATAGQDYELSVMGREQTITYLLLPDDKSGRNAIAAMYLMQIYSGLTRLANESPGGRLPVPVFWLLDEFANVGKFKDWDKMVSVARGRGMSITMVLQEFQQLEARYGRDIAATIAGNADTWVYLRGNTLETAKRISEKLGQYTIRTRTGSSTARRFELSTGSSEHLGGRKLLTPDEVLRWPVGQALVMQAGQFPAKLSLPDLSEWPIADFMPSGPPPERQDPSRDPDAAEIGPLGSRPVPSDLQAELEASEEAADLEAGEDLLRRLEFEGGSPTEKPSDGAAPESQAEAEPERRADQAKIEIDARRRPPGRRIRLRRHLGGDAAGGGKPEGAAPAEHEEVNADG